MGHLEERDLRSLERRSMYSIFAPLEGDDGLSLELALDDKSNPTRSGELAVWGFLRRRVRRRPSGDEQWVPAMFMFVRRFSYARSKSGPPSGVSLLVRPDHNAGGCDLAVREPQETGGPPSGELIKQRDRAGRRRPADSLAASSRPATAA